MKLMKFNEEFFNLGKTKVVLPGGTIIYISDSIYDKSRDSFWEKLDEKNINIIKDDILKIVNNDLGDGWKIDKIEKMRFLIIHLSNNNYGLSIRLDKPVEFGKGGNSHLEYKSFFKKDLNIDFNIKVDNYVYSNGYFSINYSNPFNYSTTSPVTRDVFEKIPNFDSPEMVEIINNQINIRRAAVEKIKEETKKKKEIADKRNKDYIDFKNIYPQLIEDIKDIFMEIKDYTSFSTENINNIRNPEYFAEYFTKYKAYTIYTFSIYWDKLNGKKVVVSNYKDWDYLTDISLKIKQIEAHIDRLNNEYFNNSRLEIKMGFNLEEFRLFINLKLK